MQFSWGSSTAEFFRCYLARVIWKFRLKSQSHIKSYSGNQPNSNTDMSGQVVSNTQVIVRNQIKGVPNESDFYVTSSHLKLELPKGSKEILVKNLYLSCDPYMRGYKKTAFDSRPFTPFTPGSVCALVL